MSTSVKNNNNYKKKNNNIKNVKKERVEIEFRDITEDFSKEVEEKKRIIILVEHSKSYAKEYAFKAYVNKRFQYRGEKYIVAVAHFDYITPDKLSPQSVTEILKSDLNQAYNDFKAKYPQALLEKAMSFNYAIDFSQKSQKAEIMSLTLMRISDEYSRVQFSPIVQISKEQYNMLIGNDKTDEGKLVYEIFTEKRMGIEQYGIVGYLTDGKFKTHNMYMEGLLDLIPEYKDEEGFRTKKLEYKNYRTSKKAYLFSVKTEEEKEEFLKNENEPIV